jgi:hypothetical protein
VIRGPHKDKDSREHFEMRIHKRILDILEPSPKTVDSLQRIELPAGVDIEIKIQQAYQRLALDGGADAPLSSTLRAVGLAPMADRSTEVRVGPHLAGTAWHNLITLRRAFRAERSREPDHSSSSAAKRETQSSWRQRQSWAKR